jgi:regulator of protease activity HflC (stomatin/prohibitin superfamily)
MPGLIMGVIAGALVIFIIPSLLPDRVKPLVPSLAFPILGVLIIVFALASTSFVYVPDGYSAHLFRVYTGRVLPPGRIVAAEGENGPQARLLAPGFHFEPLLNVFYNVDTSRSELDVPPNKVGILTAKDGASLRFGQTFADPFPSELGTSMLDAERFLKQGGQRGPQLSVLTSGRYRLNHYLWDVQLIDAVEVPAGYVGVIKSNVHAAVDFGTLKSDKPADCTPLDGEAVRNEQHIDAPVVPVGCIGVWSKSLQPGRYYLNTNAFGITDIDTRAQVWIYAGGYTNAQISLTVDAKGEIVQKRTEVNIPVDENNADRAVFLKMEGWDVPLELRVVAQVGPNDAACVVAGIGTLKQIEDRVLTPSIRAITRDVAGGTYEVTEPKVDENGKPVLDADGKPIIVTVNRPTKVLDLINQRPLIESEIERRIRPEGRKSCITIREVRLGEPAIPPELLVAVRREQLATQLAKAFIQEQAAQQQRVTSEKAKATADQQSQLVQAEIEVQRSVQLAQAARNTGQGDRDKLAAIAEGQKKQMDVLGLDATVKLRQFELVLQFAQAHPEVVAAMFNNAHKFVPQVTVGAGGDALGGMISAFMGEMLNRGNPDAQPPTMARPPR